jgi:4-hydroxybenzoate polyprenyltransferase
VKHYLALLRPAQWIKNGFVLAPLIFSRSFLDGGAVVRALAAFAVFCAASSAGYVINDLVDRERDRQHPLKRTQRPIAAGHVSPRGATLVVALLLPLALIAAWLLSLQFLAAVATYLAVSIAYSVRLKDLPIVDLFAIAVGFVLRVWGGAVALPVALSVWMFITALSLALYLAATKRRQELLSSGTAVDFRAVLQHYTVRLMDYYSEIAAVATFVFYSLYIANVRPQLALTIPVVLFGLFRYRYLMELDSGGHVSPTDALLRDPQLIACAVVWTAVSVVVLFETS